jgi:catechol 2,3-dioxygenase-like lactoylglutathione lyase family enzyme
VEVLSSRTLIAVSDFERSRAFYETTLGLKIYREYGAAGHVTGVVYFLGGGFLELTIGTTRPSTDGVRIWLQVEDLAGEETRLHAAGVTFRKGAELMPWGLIECWIEDPDGVELRLVEVPSEHPLRRRVD